MSLKFPRAGTDDADLDVTAFLNLMIVLVPVLLLSMTFAKVTVLEINLPELTGGEINSLESQGKLEVVVTKSGYQVFYPESTLIKEIPLIAMPIKESTAKTGAVSANDSSVTAGPNTASEDVQGEGVMDTSYDYRTLSLVMQALKQQLTDKRDVLLRLDKHVDYEDLVRTMDAVKSYKTVVVTSVEEIELFPEISLGDAS